MIDLLERAPDGWVLVYPHGMPPGIHFYYGVRAGESHLLPVGAHFGVVYSPNHYVHPSSPLHPWAYVVFEVELYKFRHDRPLERSYKQIRRRQLTRFEVPHFEQAWTEILLMGERRAG